MTDQQNGVPGERSISPLGDASSQRTKRMIGLAAAAGAVGITAYFALASEQSPPKAPQRAEAVVQEIDFKPAPPPVKQVALVTPPKPAAAPAMPPSAANAPAPAPSGDGKAMAEAIASPLIVSTQTERGAPTQASAAASDRAQTDDTPLAAHLRTTRLTGSAASILPDRDYMITAGAHIQCVLQTAMDSTQPGLTACVVPVDVLSDNGRVVLMEKGTRIVGQYQADLKQGQSRIFVVWTRAETPAGVIIDLGSPGTDALGRAGFDGQIDTHFWERFGGAILLSVIDDALATYEQQQQKANTTINETNTQAATSSSASTALQNTINIPPTLIKNQGEEVAVMVARDLDFRGVYKLVSVGTR